MKLYFIGFGHYLYEVCSFLLRNRKGMDLDDRGGREELRGAEGGEPVVRKYCMRKETIYNKKGKWEELYC